MPIYSGHEWAWRNIASPFPENITMFPAGQYPSQTGWIRVDTSGNPISDFNTWENQEGVDRIVWPQDISNVDMDKVRDTIITTRASRAQLYGLAKIRFERSVNYIRSVKVGIISPFGYQFKWPVAMED